MVIEGAAHPTAAVNVVAHPMVAADVVAHPTVVADVVAHPTVAADVVACMAETEVADTETAVVDFHVVAVDLRAEVVVLGERTIGTSPVVTTVDGPQEEEARTSESRTREASKLAGLDHLLLLMRYNDYKSALLSSAPVFL